MRCGLSYTLMVQTPTRTLKPVTYVWINCSPASSSSGAAGGSPVSGSGPSVIRIYSMVKTQQIVLKVSINILSITRITHARRPNFVYFACIWFTSRLANFCQSLFAKESCGIKVQRSLHFQCEPVIWQRQKWTLLSISTRKKRDRKVDRWAQKSFDNKRAR